MSSLLGALLALFFPSAAKRVAQAKRNRKR